MTERNCKNQRACTEKARSAGLMRVLALAIISFALTSQAPAKSSALLAAAEPNSYNQITGACQQAALTTQGARKFNVTRRTEDAGYSQYELVRDGLMFFAVLFLLNRAVEPVASRARAAVRLRSARHLRDPTLY